MTTPYAKHAQNTKATLQRAGLPDLAYQWQVGDADRPIVMFLHGFRSDMTGSKAEYLAEYCATHNLAYIRFDARGHGKSQGRFEDGTIGEWLDDALAIFDALVNRPVILVGSSMGGWLAVLLARQRAEKIHGIIGIAAAPDFMEDLVWAGLSSEQRAELARNGIVYEESAYSDTPNCVTTRMIEEARNHLVLRSAIDLTCPVRLLQGMRDPDVPYPVAIRLAEALESQDVEILLIKDGDHRLSRDSDLALLGRAVEGLADI